MATERSTAQSKTSAARQVVQQATAAPKSETTRAPAERADYAVDDRTGAKVIDSIVLRGDLSGLGPAERTRFYIQMCEGLGLNPHAQPFAFLRLNGKEVLYATRGATDQLAAMHRVTRRIIDGPKVIDIAGTKLVYAVCEASLPNGRVETATATLPVIDPVNMLMKCECVPLDSEILTRRGFRCHDQLTVGEEVLAYDAASDRTEWVPLENVTVYPEAAVWSLHTPREQFSVRCTSNHSWAVQVPAPKSTSRALVEAEAIKSHHRLILAAPGPDGDHPMSPERAAVLGWVMCDGTIQRRESYVRLGIYQSKPERVAEIRELLGAAGFAFTETEGEPTERTFPSGKTYDCLPQHTFWLDGETSWWLLQEAGLAGPEGLPSLVTRLSYAAREAMLNAMLAADGDARGNFGKKRKPGVMEAFQILTTLQGRALGMLRESSVGEVPIQRAMSTRFVAGSNLTLTPGSIEAVWCPTTKHGTWVMRQNGRITITGNTKAKRRATLSILGLGVLDEMEIETIPAGAQEPGGRVDFSQVNPLAEAEAEGSQEPRAPDPATAHPALGGFYARLNEIELPGESVAVWLKFRADLGPLPIADREAAWRALCKRTEEVGRMKNAKVWLKKAIAEEDTRRGSTNGAADSHAA